MKSARGKDIKPARTKYAKHLKEQGQNAMRERIKGQQHLNQIIKNVKKLQNLNEKLEPTEVTRLKVACDQHFKILGKILPDIKQTEINVSGAIEHKSVDELSITELEKIIDRKDYEVVEDDE